MENQIITDKVILQLFITEKGKLNRNYLRQTWLDKHENIKQYLQNRFIDSESITETIARIKYNIEVRPVCPICGNKTTFRGFNEHGGNACFSIYCSLSCSNSDIESRKAQLLEHYGVTNVFQLKSVKNKIKETCLNRYGVEYSGQAEQKKEKTRETCLDRYGVEQYFETNEFKEKSKATCLKKYGVEYSFQSDNNKEKSKLTCLKKYGTEYATQSQEVKEKTRETCLNKYGVEYISQVQEIKEKVRNTFIEKYGGIGLQSLIIFERYKTTIMNKYGGIGYSSNIIAEKIKQTILKLYGTEIYIDSADFKDKTKVTNLSKFGVEWSLQSQEVQEKIKATNLLKYGAENVLSNKSIIRKKAVDTILNRYGVIYPLQSDIIKQHAIQNNIVKYGYNYYAQMPEARYYLSNKISDQDVQNKINSTKKKNKSFNTSKPEDELYNYVIQFFPDIERSYRSTDYPFNCDFYIKSLDLYIEFQGSWTHGGHPFDENNIEDLQKVEKWKSKNTRYYDNAIKTWTIRDVKKRAIAKQNNLNYIELWNLDEAKQFIISLIK